MINRVILYVSKNFGKMLSTFLMFVVMLSLIGTLGYVYATVNNRVSEVKVVRHNYVVDFEKLWGDGSYEEEEAYEESLEEEVEYKSYEDIYDKALTLDGLTAYKIDTLGSGGYHFVGENKPDDQEFGNDYVLEIADDYRQIDFVTKKVEMLYGDLDSSGIVISEDVANANGFKVGDTISITKLSLAIYEEGSEYEDTNPTEFAYEHEIEVTGIYRFVEKQEDNGIMGEMIGEPIYMSQDQYRELSTKLTEEENAYLAEVYGVEDGEYMENMPDFQRVLAQYDNEKSAKELDEYVEKEYDFVYTVDSGKEIEKSKEPLNDFKTIITIALIVTVIISGIGIYLNMYLKLDKRRSEFICLLACGINSVKLSIQVFLEQLLFLLLSIPFAYLLVKAISGTVLEIVKMYYIVVIQENMGENDEFFGSWLEYITIDAADVVDFTSANLFIVLSSVGAIMFILLLLLSLVEVMRRYKNVKKV